MACVLPPGQQLAAPGKWPLVGERAPRGATPDGIPPANAEPWRVSIAGQVERQCAYQLDELRSLGTVRQAIDIHCVTRWSKLAVEFVGVPLATLVAQACPTTEARYVSFVARSERDHSTSLPLSEALSLGALVALEAEGRPLPVEHGGPVRMIVPGRYFYKSLKWLERIELLASDRLGYWEREAGYHNRADAWREERYLAPALSKREMAAVLATRDFSNRDLRSIDARGHDLTGLIARGALLRDADFRDCLLRAACFDGANLANAHLQGADLRGASFVSADLEGTDFISADLRGADLRGASLFGATFRGDGDSSSPAVLDGTTLIDATSLEQLTPLEAEHVVRAIQ